MNEFRLYLSNATVYATQTFRCYTDQGKEGYPDVTQDINCNYLTKNVFFFNRRYTGEGAFVELCYVAIYGWLYFVFFVM